MHVFSSVVRGEGGSVQDLEDDIHGKATILVLADWTITYRKIF